MWKLNENSTLWADFSKKLKIFKYVYKILQFIENLNLKQKYVGKPPFLNIKYLYLLNQTGLDSSSSNYTIRLLHGLAREGRTIVCTIHQPSATIYEMFDHVYVLAEGHCIYQGSSDNTVPFLSSQGLNCPQYHNAADYMLEVANGEYGNFVYQLAKAAIDERWRASSSTVYISDSFDQNMIDKIEKIEDLDATSNNTDEKRISVYTKTSEDYSSKMSQRSGFYSQPSELTRLWILIGEIFNTLYKHCCCLYLDWLIWTFFIGRCNVQLFRDWTVTHLKLLLHILCALVIGLYFGNSGVNASKSISNIGFLLVNLVYIWYTTMMPGVLRFPSEISILKKETFNNWYKLKTYYIASLITR